MKLLQNSEFDAISSSLSIQRYNAIINGTLESYSCKMTGTEKKTYKLLNTAGRSPFDLALLSPSESQQLQEPSPDLSNENPEDGLLSTCVINQKMLFTLRSTLNAAFPDYNFTQAKSEEFSRETNFPFVINNVNSILESALGKDFVGRSPSLWKAIDDEISLTESEIYSYNPDMENDPFAEEGSLWSFNYLFYNKDMKRIVFLNCHGSTATRGLLHDDLNDEGQLYMDWSDNENRRIKVY